MPIILAVENQKGGCGKTTTVMNLAGGFHKAGYRVLVVDADPQASSLHWSIAMGQASLAFDVTTARLLKNKVSALLEADVDLVLVDCPPGIADAGDVGGKFARDCLREADAILVPVLPSTLDFAAAQTFVRYLVESKRPEVKTAVLINGRRNNLLGRQARDQAAVLFAPITGAIILQTTVGLRTPITEVSGSGQTIFDYAPTHAAALEYFNLTKEIIQWLRPAQESTSLTSVASTSPSAPSVSA